MKYWFDTEFIDSVDSLDLVSIGIIAEDNRTYYAVSNEFDSQKACLWVKENVFPLLIAPNLRKNKAQIKDEIIAFIIDKPEFWVFNGAYDWVLFCKLFGNTSNLPNNYPKFAYDVKQLSYLLNKPYIPRQHTLQHHALEDAKWTKDSWEFLNNYNIVNKIYNCKKS